MTSIKMELTGLSKAVRDNDPREFNKRLKRGLEAAGVEVKGELMRYPPRRYKKMEFKTDKQRRGFFARLRSGEIEVPYRRGLSPNSEKMNTRWLQKPRRNGLQIELSNTTSYGPLLQDDDTIAEYHEDTWKGHTVQAVAARKEDKVVDIVNHEITKDWTLMP